MPQLWVVYNPRLYSDCGGPTSIPHTFTIYCRLCHDSPPCIFTWHTEIQARDKHITIRDQECTVFTWDFHTDTRHSWNFATQARYVSFVIFTKRVVIMCRLILAIVAVLIFVACEDSAIIQEVDFLNEEVSPSETAGISGNMLNEMPPRNCFEAVNQPGAGSGELAISACIRADSSYEVREFNIRSLVDYVENPTMEGGFNEFSLDTSCQGTHSGFTNFMLGVGRSGRSCSGDTSNDLSEQVTYMISSISDEPGGGIMSWFVARWNVVGASNPDVWARTVNGTFEEKSCPSSVSCSDLHANIPLSLNTCYTFETAPFNGSRVFSPPWGNSTFSCGHINWFAPGVLSPPRFPDPASFYPNLVRVFVDPATSIGYDWDYSGEMSARTFHLPDSLSLNQLSFAEGVTRPTRADCNAYLNTFGTYDEEDGEYSIVGWMYQSAGIIKNCDEEDEPPKHI